MTKDYLNQLNGVVDNDIGLFSGGINFYNDKAFLNPDQLAFAVNMSMYKPPMMCTRPTREFAHALLTEDHADLIIRKMWSDDIDYAYAVVSNKYDFTYQIIRLQTNGQGSHEWISSYSKADENARFCYARTQTNEYLYVVGNSYKGKININDVSFHVADLNDGHFGIPCWHKGRMFFANPSTNTITFSALNDFDNFTEFPDMSNQAVMQLDIALIDGTAPTLPAYTGAYTTGQHVITLNGTQYAGENTVFYYDNTEKSYTFQTGAKLVYENASWQSKMPDYSSYAGEFFVTNAKGKIKALASFDDKLVIFCEHSIHLLYGDTPLTNSSYQFQLVDLNNNLGCLDANTVAIGGGRLYWLGDDREIYAYSGSSIDVISRPASSRYATRYSGICTQLIPDSATFIAAATTDKYYIRLTLLSREPYHESAKHYLFVYDALNRVWWAEDSGYEGLGSLSAISSFNSDKNTVLLAFGDQILKTTREYFGYDNVYNFTKAIAEHHDIEYEFQTRVFGVDGADSRKSISRVWFQASANADVYLSDAWTAVDRWISQTHSATLKKIGALEKKGRPTFNRQEPYEDVYEQDLYEQQVCYVEKMYGQRLNTFQVVVKGTGSSKFYLMKREWGAR